MSSKPSGYGVPVDIDDPTARDPMTWLNRIFVDGALIGSAVVACFAVYGVWCAVRGILGATQ